MIYRLCWLSLALPLVCTMVTRAAAQDEAISRQFATGVGEKFTQFETSEVYSRAFSTGVGTRFTDLNTNQVFSRAFSAGVGEQFGGLETKEVFSRQFAAGVGSSFIVEPINEVYSRQFAVSIPVPDLVPQVVNAPAVTSAGEEVTIEWTVANTTEVDADGEWIDAVYLVPAGAGLSRLPIAELTKTGGLLGNSNYTNSVMLTIPENQTPGSYEAVVYTNYGGDLFEEEFDNNVLRSSPFNIQEIPLPDLTVTSVSSAADGFALQPIEVSWTVQNVGNLEASGSWVDRVLAVSVHGTSETITLAEFPQNSSVAPTASYGRTETVPYPGFGGDYILAVETNANRTLTETSLGGFDNNRKLSDGTFNVDSYLVTAQTETEENLAPASVTITGEARQLSTNVLLEGAVVSVGVEIRGIRRLLTTTTDENGAYSVVFQPLSREAGLYSLRAGPPGALSEVQDTFTLYGGRVAPNQPEQITVYTNGSPAKETVRFLNNGNVPLTGLAATLNLPGELSGGTRLSTEIIPPDGFVDVTVTVQSSQSRSKRQGLGSSLELVTAEGVGLTHPLTFDLRSSSIDLGFAPSSLSFSALRSTELDSKQELREITVTNNGSIVSSELTISLPDEDWISLTTPNPLPPIQPGGSSKIGLRVSPGPELPLSVFSGNLAVNGSNGFSQSIPLSVRIQSTALGNLAVNVTDEFSYWDADGGYPQVSGAEVRLRDGLTDQFIDRMTTGANGIATFEDITEGFYTVETTSPQHARARQSVYIDADQTTEIEAFISRQLVRYDWSVTPVQIEDRYRIDLFATFETFVPAPVVTIEPAYLNLDEFPDGPTQITFTITNHGLIRANELNWGFTNSPGVSITPLVEAIGDLDARATIQIPVVFDVSSQQEVARSGGCGPGLKLNWNLLCGTQQNYSSAVSLDQSRAGGSGCSGGSGSASGEGGGGGWITPHGSATLGNCDPCINDLLGAALICGLGAIPGPVGCAVGGLSCANDLASIDSGLSAATAVAGCGASAAGCFIPGAGVPAAAVCLFLATEKCGLISDLTGARQAVSLSSAKRYFIEQIDRLKDSVTPLRVILGNEKWFDDVVPDEADLMAEFLVAWVDGSRGATFEELRLDAEEQVAMLALPKPSHLTTGDIQQFIDRWNRTMDYYEADILELADVPFGSSRDFIAVSAFQQATAEWQEAEEAVAAEGFASILDAATFASQAMLGAEENTPSGICARVVIKISQEAVLSRTAFEADLEMVNQGTLPLENLAVTLYVRDANNNLVSSDVFAINDPELSGIATVDGSENLNGRQTLNAKWTLIPTDQAAPISAASYGIGGVVSYFLDGQYVELPLFPVNVDVLPNPALELDYFLVRNVYSDDPFTEEVEAAEPFDLGVLVTNSGVGQATNLKIASSQPEIIDNEKGLLVDFQIIGTQVGMDAVEPTLEANFGDLEAGTSRTARWLMTSSLQGEFIEFGATFEHLSQFGSNELSLIDRVDIHPLIRSVRADIPFDDGEFDFLADDAADLQDLPDKLYESNGNTSPVVGRIDATITSNSGTENEQTVVVEISETAEGNLYIRLEDELFDGYTVTGVQRLNDGRTMLSEWNAWITARNLRISGQPVSREVRFHLFDIIPSALNGETVRYEVSLVKIPETLKINDGFTVY